MSSLLQTRAFLESNAGQEFLLGLYGDCVDILLSQRKRYRSLLDRFESDFPNHQNAEVCSVPGRTEVGGNHTDHENGRVLAAAVDLDTVGTAARNDDDVICIHSEGYVPLEISLDNLEPHLEERNSSSALVRGICQYFRQNQYGIGGFDACFTSDVPGGSGLSSSASFEVLVAELLNVLFNQGRLNPLALARAGHFSERTHFGKPSGMMDQMTSAVGGFVTIDFSDPSQPIVRQVNFDPTSSGYDLVITETGRSHAGLTDEYAAITAENRAVAQFFGAVVLRDVDEAEFKASLPELRKKVGDRAVLRAVHFFDDNRRVNEQVAALESGYFARFLELVNESGRSSWTLLQNCYSCKNAAEQGIPLALTLSAQLLSGRGAWRVHGGGFAGTVQAFVPHDLLTEYVAGMERVFGRGACRGLRIRPVGATRLPVPA